MAVIQILVAGVLVLFTMALVRVLSLFRRPAITEANVLDRKHNSKCGTRKDSAYKVAIIGAGKWFSACGSIAHSTVEGSTPCSWSLGFSSRGLEICTLLQGR